MITVLLKYAVEVFVEVLLTYLIMKLISWAETRVGNMRHTTLALSALLTLVTAIALAVTMNRSGEYFSPRLGYLVRHQRSNFNTGLAVLPATAEVCVDSGLLLEKGDGTFFSPQHMDYISNPLVDDLDSTFPLFEEGKFLNNKGSIMLVLAVAKWRVDGCMSMGGFCPYSLHTPFLVVLPSDLSNSLWCSAKDGSSGAFVSECSGFFGIRYGSIVPGFPPVHFSTPAPFPIPVGYVSYNYPGFTQLLIPTDIYGSTRYEGVNCYYNSLPSVPAKQDAAFKRLAYARRQSAKVNKTIPSFPEEKKYPIRGRTVTVSKLKTPSTGPTVVQGNSLNRSHAISKTGRMRSCTFIRHRLVITIPGRSIRHSQCAGVTSSHLTEGVIFEELKQPPILERLTQQVLDLTVQQRSLSASVIHLMAAGDIKARLFSLETIVEDLTRGVSRILEILQQRSSDSSVCCCSTKVSNRSNGVSSQPVGSFLKIRVVGSPPVVCYQGLHSQESIPTSHSADILQGPERNSPPASDFSLIRFNSGRPRHVTGEVGVLPSPFYLTPFCSRPDGALLSGIKYQHARLVYPTLRVDIVSDRRRRIPELWLGFLDLYLARRITAFWRVFVGCLLFYCVRDCLLPNIHLPLSLYCRSYAYSLISVLMSNSLLHFVSGPIFGPALMYYHLLLSYLFRSSYSILKEKPLAYTIYTRHTSTGICPNFCQFCIKYIGCWHPRVTSFVSVSSALSVYIDSMLGKNKINAYECIYRDPHFRVIDSHFVDAPFIWAEDSSTDPDSRPLTFNLVGGEGFGWQRDHPTKLPCLFDPPLPQGLRNELNWDVCPPAPFLMQVPHTLNEFETALYLKESYTGVCLNHGEKVQFTCCNQVEIKVLKDIPIIDDWYHFYRFYSTISGSIHPSAPGGQSFPLPSRFHHRFRVLAVTRLFMNTLCGYRMFQGEKISVLREEDQALMHHLLSLCAVDGICVTCELALYVLLSNYGLDSNWTLQGSRLFSLAQSANATSTPSVGPEPMPQPYLEDEDEGFDLF